MNFGAVKSTLKARVLSSSRHFSQISASIENIQDDFADIESHSSLSTVFSSEDERLQIFDPIKRSTKRLRQLPPSRLVYFLMNFLSIAHHSTDINSALQGTIVVLSILTNLLQKQIPHHENLFPARFHLLD